MQLAASGASLEDKDKELRAALLDIKRLERKLAPKRPVMQPPQQQQQQQQASLLPSSSVLDAPPWLAPQQQGPEVHVMLLVVKDEVRQRESS